MPRTDLENLQKRRWASKYWRNLPAEKELRGLTRHELLRPPERRAYEQELATGDPEQLARSLTALRHILLIREREKLRFEKAYPTTARLRAAA